MTDQEHYIILVVDDKEYICNNTNELISCIQSNTEYVSREIRFFKNREYDEQISKRFNKNYDIYNK
jgi:hypothetical protein